MASLVFDPARNLTLYFRCNRTPLAQTLSFYDAAGNAFPLASYTFQLNIKYRDGDTANRVTLTEGAGLVKSGNTLTINPTATQAAIREARYYYELQVTFGGGVYVWICGDAEFHNGKFDSVDNTSVLTISNTSTPVSVVISRGTSSPNVNVDTAPATINLDWAGLDEVNFAGSAIINGNKNITTSNTQNAQKGALLIELSGTYVLTMPSNFFFVGFQGGWDGTLKQLTLDAGKYVIKFPFVSGANFYLELSGAY